MSQVTNDLSNPLDFPLYGSRLIEASAGTGKTYTIAALYVRLVLKHGGEKLAYSRELLPKDILVMTFTRAATAELSERIRAKLSEAADFFRKDDACTSDIFLHNLKESFLEDAAESKELSKLARRLELAAESMDESAVHTINGWCQKMLTEHAFASGSLFEQNIETEEEDLKLAAAEDYFRRFIYDLPIDSAKDFIEILVSPQNLVGKVGRVDVGENLSSNNYPTLKNAQDDAISQAKNAVRIFKEKYQSATELLDLICSLPETGNKGRKTAASELKKWLDNDSAIEIEIPSADRKYLTYEDMQKKLKENLPVCAEIFKDFPSDLQQINAIAKHAVNDLFKHAYGFIFARFQELKQQAAQMGFDDMLTRLRDALRGANGNNLAHTIRNQFPVALIDEFQDTDPVQYEIFDTIYGVEQNDPSTGIFLIGDPKQAIYSFRNADIFTYLKARQATTGRHYTLAKNYRSSKQMVEAVNSLFSFTDLNTKRGAFLYKNDIPFVRVSENGQQRVFKGIDGGETAALQWHIDPEPAAKRESYQKNAAKYHADLIAKLLNSERAGFYSGDHHKPVEPRDIAILVANAQEARLIRNELTIRGIRSVYLSERDSVYSQNVAKDLLALVQACAQPKDPAKLRTALAVPVLAQSIPQLIEYQENELAWEAAVERFIGYHELWQKFGILAALMRLLHDFSVPGRLLADSKEGERQLADTLHICELLQQESMRLEGMARLEEFFSQQVQEYQDAFDPSGSSAKRTDSESLQLRLESDEDLVKVVTYHKSKGLQYPLVFMPFPAYTSETRYRFKDSKFPLTYHELEEDGVRVKRIAWNSSDLKAMKCILEEALAEDIRKMYVALTRAEFATFVSLQLVGDIQNNPMFYFLFGDSWDSKNEIDLLSKAQQCWNSEGANHTEVVVMSLGEQQNLQSKLILPVSLAARNFVGSAKRNPWWVTSYSALNYGSSLSTPETAQQMNLLEGLREDTGINKLGEEKLGISVADEVAAQINRVGGRIHHLPKGAGVGTFLHTLLEDAATYGFGQVASFGQLREQILEARCRVPQWQEYRQDLDSWLKHYLECTFEISGMSVSLAELKSYKAEPEFWFETRHVDTRCIDKLIAKSILPEYERPQLDGITLNGMLKGFIDLVFEYQGKYYVADYKSNWLGDSDFAYSQQNMRQKILASRYDLQYVIYTLALHKLLKARLGASYDYDSHIGGAVYLFLRGHLADTKGAFFDRPPRELIEDLEREFLSQGENHACVN